MASDSRYYAAACQTDLPCPRDRGELPERVGRLLGMVDRAVVGYEPFFDVKLVVFPEFAHAAPIYETVEELSDRLAVPIPNEHTDRYVQKARERGVFIQTGTFLEVDPKWRGAVFNTTCLIGPDGLLSRYRKVNPWLPWEVHASPHDLRRVRRAAVSGGRDRDRPAGRGDLLRLAFPGVDPGTGTRRGGGLDPRLGVHGSLGRDAATGLVDAVQPARAVENFAFVVAANQGASAENYPPFSWPGGSMVVDYDGRILAQADPGPGEKIVVGPIDLAALRAERERRRGHHFLSHLRAEAYTDLYARPIFRPGGRPA